MTVLFTHISFSAVTVAMFNFHILSCCNFFNISRSLCLGLILLAILVGYGNDCVIFNQI